MDEKQMLQEITQTVTKDVLEALKKELPVRKDIFGNGEQSTEAQVLEKKQKAAEYIKALYRQDFASVKAMSEGTSADGGYLVPDYFASEVIRLAPQYGVVRANARIVPMTGHTLKFPTASTVTGYRIGENTTITASKPTITQTTLTAKKVAALIPMSAELLQDANVDVVDLLTRLSAEAITKVEDDWGLLGLGAGEGIFQNASAQVFTLATGGTTYAKVGLDDLLDTLSLLDESALPNAKWYMSFSVFNAIRKIKDSQNRPIVQLPGNGMPATLWDIPVVFCRNMPKTSDGAQTSKNFIAVGDLNYMLLGDRKEYTVDISREASVIDTDGSTRLDLFSQDMAALRVIERIDIELAEAAKAFAMVKTAAS